MEIASIREAETRLAQLVDRALSGEEVIISRDGHSAVRLTPVSAVLKPRSRGQWRGRVTIATDFDELPDDVATPFEVEPS